MKHRTIVAGLILLCTATFILAARQGVVTTSDGQRIEGEVTETKESITVSRHGVRTVFPREEVSNIDYSNYEDRFEQTLAALSPDDVEGRLQLAREAFKRREYELAQRAVDAAIDINPLNRSAMELSRSIASQMTLEGSRKRTPATTRTATTRAETSQAEKRRYRGLSPEQINVVRQFELRKGDQVRIQFRNNARKAFVDTQPGLTFREFNMLTDVDQALQVLNKGSEDLRRDIILLSDPSSIRTFSRRLSTAVIQGCATSQCHGGPGAGDFRLLSGTPDPSTLVTNFYLLTTYTKAVDGDEGNPFGSSQLSMIDRTTPGDSMLYQYALPRSRAKFKHPEVRNWNGIVANENDRFIRDLVDWIQNELSPVKPSYGFDFSLAATSQPATRRSDEAPAGGATAAEGSTDSSTTQPAE